MGLVISAIVIESLTKLAIDTKTITHDGVETIRTGNPYIAGVGIVGIVSLYWVYSRSFTENNFGINIQ